MVELELTRSAGDRRLYELGDLGTLRFQGLFAGRALAETDGSRWQIGRTGFWRRGIHAVDASGGVVGEFDPHSFRRGGRVRWRGRELALRPASRWRERYALVDGDRELAVLDVKGWGRTPVRIGVDDAGAIEPGLLLFAAFVVRALAEDDTAAAAAAASAPGG
jgi:hypothetical protein